MLKADSATRGAATTLEGTGVRPERSHSETCVGAVIEQ